VCGDFTVTDQKKEFANCFGRALQIGDDIVDADVDLKDGDIEEEFESTVTELKSYGYTSVDVLTFMKPRHLDKLMNIEKEFRRLLKSS